MKVLYRIVITLLGMVMLITACGPVATPEVIQDFSRSFTLTAAARPTLTPTGPTRTPTMTSTPYIRATDSTDLDLALAIVQIGDETISLGQFRARVRYERFRLLNNARRIVETLGIENFNFSKPTGNNTEAVQQVSGVFNALANSDRFGRDIYDVMVREAITRREFASRNLALKADDITDYWIRQFDMQMDKDAKSKIPAILDQYAAVAERYSGLSRAELDLVAETAVKADALRPIIGNEFAVLPDAITYKVKRVIAASQADADAALKTLQAGESFRNVACQYSTDPVALGNGGTLGTISRGGLTPGLNGSDQVFAADVGAIVGPLSSPLGYHLFKINGKRTNADGDALVDLQTIVVATESLANDIRQRLEAGEDFVALACQYSLDNTSGNGGDYGFVSDQKLPKEVVLALNPIRDDQMKQYVGPIQAGDKWEVVYVEERKIDVPSPADLERLRQQAFVDWLTNQANSLLVTSLNDTWQTLIPTDPLPRDVAPFMTEENFGLPTPVPTSMRTVTPTPSATIDTP